MGAAYAGPNGGLPPTSSGFDSRTEAAFSAAGNTAGPGATQNSGAPSGFSNGGTGGYEGQADPFSFLAPSLGALNIDEKRRNGAVGQGNNNGA